MKLWMRSYALMFLAVSLVAMTWSAAFRLIDGDYLEKLHKGEERAVEIAGFFERDAQRIINMAEVYVREAARLYKEGGTEAVDAFMHESPHGQTIISHVTIADADGMPVFVSGHDIKPGVSLSDRAYFQQLRDNTTNKTTLSLPLVGRNTGRVTVRFARRIDTPDGDFGGVIFAAVDADQFIAFFDTLNLGPNSSATLVGTDDKRIRARSSYGRLGPGQDISGSQLWRELETQDAGLYRQTSVVDDVTRMYAYQKLDGYPLVVAIGLAEEDVVKDVRGFAVRIQTIAGLTTLVIIIFTLTICRDMYVRARMEREIAERRLAEKELADANRDLLQYAYGASHDLKAPLTSIWGLLDFCLEDLDSGDHDELRRNLQEARDISQRSSHKVENLLQIAQSNNKLASVETFSLADLVMNIWTDQTASDLSAPALELSLGVDNICTERSSVQLILENLISNALKYRDTDKTVRRVAIKATLDGQLLRIIVWDNGVGIPESYQPHIFDSFKSFDDRGGDGLGLALVEKHVARLGATLKVDSRVGEYTAFEVEMPIVKGDKNENSSDRGRRQRDRPLHDQTPARAS